MAQMAGMSTEAFEDFYFRVCLLDYKAMLPAMRALVKLMDKTDQVHLKGPGTDLRFSIKGIPALASGGNYNIPDGECFTSPVKDSVEGVVNYNAPSIYQGIAFDGVKLEFSKGKIVRAEAAGGKTKALNKILNTDPGARYIGEFAIGFNPEIREPMRDILFDEKIAGSFHFTPGQAYEDADNGNRSQVHWDLVNIQRSDWGRWGDVVRWEAGAEERSVFGEEFGEAESVGARGARYWLSVIGGEGTANQPSRIACYGGQDRRELTRRGLGGGFDRGGWALGRVGNPRSILGDWNLEMV